MLVALVLAVLGVSSEAHAEFPVLSARSRVDDTNVSALVSTESFGIGGLMALRDERPVPDAKDATAASTSPASAPASASGSSSTSEAASMSASASQTSDVNAGALSAELAYAPLDGVGELRAARSWQLTDPHRLFSSSLLIGASSYLVVKGPVDFGIGPNAGIFAGWGRRNWEVWFGAQGGVEAFVRTGGPRFPVRALVGVRGRTGDIGASLTARGGTDFDPEYAMAWRGEVVLTVGWYGLPN